MFVGVYSKVQKLTEIKLIQKNFQINFRWLLGKEKYCVNIVEVL